MNKYDIVTLTSLTKEYEAHNLSENNNGIILDVKDNDNLLVLFFNNEILDDCAVIEVNRNHIAVQNEKLPKKIIDLFNQNQKFIKENFYNKHSLNKIILKEYTWVELIIDKPKYLKQGLHKGMQGIVAYDKSISGEVLVDFGEKDDGNYFNDCVSIKIEDLKKIN